MPDDPNIVIYALPGSQYVAKTLIALDARNLHHAVEFVSALPHQRRLPSGGTLVPEAVINGAVVPDSDAILRHLDERFSTDFFPNASAAELTHRFSEGKLAGFVLFYNWVHPPSYARSMRAAFSSALPSWLGHLRGLIIDALVASRRRAFRLKAAQQIGVEESAFRDEGAMRALLLDELLFIQGLVHTERQESLVAGASKLTAADATVYAMLERLVGDMGDVQLPCALPELLEEERLALLWAWYRAARTRVPVRFKGKRSRNE